MTTPFDGSSFDVDVQVQRERLALSKEKMRKEQEELVHDFAEALRTWYPKEADRNSRRRTRDRGGRTSGW